MILAVTQYIPPYGRTRSIDTQMTDEDGQWFLDHNASLSMEELPTGAIVIYADVGHTLPDGTPDEAIYIVQNPAEETSIPAFHKLRIRAEHLLETPA
jgi:hypothetical protein